MLYTKPGVDEVVFTVNCDEPDPPGESVTFVGLNLVVIVVVAGKTDADRVTVVERPKLLSGIVVETGGDPACIAGKVFGVPNVKSNFTLTRKAAEWTIGPDVPVTVTV
jgi:hypothetical protein